MNLQNSEILRIIFIILMFIFLDLWTKNLAIKKLKERKKILKGTIHFVLVRNYGIAFNKFSGKKRLILSVNFLLFGYLIYLLNIDPINYFSYALILAGGLGNFISRIRDGYVTDFIYFNLKKWPVFNIADFGVFLGVGILIIREYF